MLKECVESIIQQTFTDYELVIVDNASEDGTESLIRKFHDGRIKYIKNKTNIGLNANWNLCLALARGQYITIFPDDDLMLQNNIEKKAEVLSCNPAVGLVHSNYLVIDGDSQIVTRDRTPPHNLNPNIDRIEDRLSFLLNPWSIINTSTVLFRRSCYERLGGFDPRLSIAFDWELWMRIAIYYHIAYLATPLIKWRVHAGTVTSNTIAQDEVLHLQEDILAKKLITNSHLRTLQDWRVIKKQMWKPMADRFVSIMSSTTYDPTRKYNARSLWFSMCSTYPELLWFRGVWKALRRSITARWSNRIKEYFHAPKA